MNGLEDLITHHHKNAPDNTKYFFMEFALHGLAEYSQLSKKQLVSGHKFGDLLSNMLSFPDYEEDQGFTDN